MEGGPNFELYKKVDEIPFFKGMKCYFSAPLVALISECSGFYYIIQYNKKGNVFGLSIYDEDENLGSITTRSGNIEYEADEFTCESEADIYRNLEKLGFGETAIQYAKEETQKLIKFIKEN